MRKFVYGATLVGLTALMIAATAGLIIPVYGALLQEVVDVVVIFNALRVLLKGRTFARTAPIIATVAA